MIKERSKHIGSSSNVFLRTLISNRSLNITKFAKKCEQEKPYHDWVRFIGGWDPNKQSGKAAHRRILIVLRKLNEEKPLTFKDARTVFPSFGLAPMDATIGIEARYEQVLTMLHDISLKAQSISQVLVNQYHFREASERPLSAESDLKKWLNDIASMNNTSSRRNEKLLTEFAAIRPPLTELVYEEITAGSVRDDVINNAKEFLLKMELTEQALSKKGAEFIIQNNPHEIILTDYSDIWLKILLEIPELSGKNQLPSLTVLAAKGRMLDPNDCESWIQKLDKSPWHLNRKDYSYILNGDFDRNTCVIVIGGIEAMNEKGEGLVSPGTRFAFSRVKSCCNDKSLSLVAAPSYKIRELDCFDYCGIDINGLPVPLDVIQKDNYSAVITDDGKFVHYSDKFETLSCCRKHWSNLRIATSEYFPGRV